MANGVWAASVLAQAKLCGAKFSERRPRERALNAVAKSLSAQGWPPADPVAAQRGKAVSTLANVLGREDLITDSNFSRT